MCTTSNIGPRMCSKEKTKYRTKQTRQQQNRPDKTRQQQTRQQNWPNPIQQTTILNTTKSTSHCWSQLVSKNRGSELYHTIDIEQYAAEISSFVERSFVWTEYTVTYTPTNEPVAAAAAATAAATTLSSRNESKPWRIYIPCSIAVV